MSALPFSTLLSSVNLTNLSSLPTSFTSLTNLTILFPLTASLPPTTPFLLHALLETPASLNFLLRPSSTLSTPAPSARAVIRQYAILLFVTVLIALTFFVRGTIDSVSRLVAAALALYHVGPVLRALANIVNRGNGGDGEGKNELNEAERRGSEVEIEVRVVRQVEKAKVGDVKGGKEGGTRGEVSRVESLKGRKGGNQQGKVMGGPWVFLVTHGVVFTALIALVLAEGTPVEVLRETVVAQCMEFDGAAM